MRKVGSLFASALLVVAVGCGSDDGIKSTDAGKDARPDGAVTSGVDSGTTTLDGPSTVIDAPATTDAPIVIDGLVIDAPSGVDGPALIDSGKAIDGSVNPGIDAGKGIDTGSVNPGIDAGKGIDTGAAEACNLPTCMAAVAQDCAPTGTCTTQTDTVTATMSTTISNCYANGVKTVQKTDTTGMTVTAKNATGVCYSMAIDIAAILAGGAISIPVKNAAGATIATLAVDSVTQQTSVTCPGAQPVLLNSGCTGVVSTIGSFSNCTTGTCAP